MVRLPVMRTRVFLMTPNMLLVFAWARFTPANMFNWRLHASGQCYAPNTDYGSPCNTCTDTANLGNGCADHAAALGSFGFISSHNVATRWVRHNSDTSACCDGCNSISEILENCKASELKQHRYLRIGVSAVFIIGFFVSHARICIICDFAPSRFSREVILLSRRSNGKPNFVSLPRRARLPVMRFRVFL